MEYGLIGSEVTFSYSQTIHNLIGNYNYSLLSMDEEEFISFIKNKEFLGINITIPYKEKVIPYLDELSDEAKKIKAVNTVINRDGKLIGYNTDALGFLSLLKNNNISVSNKKILILGTGGTAKTIKSVLIKEKASQIYLVSRQKKKGTISYLEAQEKYDIDIIINATPYGMYPNYEKTSLIDLKNFPFLEVVIDVIYHPLKTPLLINAKERNIKIISGLEMLVEQACYASEIFFNKKYTCEFKRSIYRQTLLIYTNIVLIGMPASGKTTACTNLAQKLNMKCIDTDQEIEKIAHMKINDIFDKYGEEEFRRIETKIIEEISGLKGAIISIGGGALLNKENAHNLMRNSTLIFLNRDLSFIKNNKRAKLTRPLFNDENAIDKLFLERYNIYRTYADIEVVTNGTKLNTLNKILEALL